MKSFDIKFQTSELVPPPYAHAIEFKVNSENNYVFELNYLDREGLTEEEIFEEGFTLEDDLSLKGILPEAWADYLINLLENSEKSFPKELKDEQEYWEIDYQNSEFYPKNDKIWKKVIEELQQAIFEQHKFELPLQITIRRINADFESKIQLKGSFENRLLTADIDQKSQILPWENLNGILKNIFSGDYNYEKASEKEPTKNGLYVNLGDQFWFEVGKSLLIKPSKITSWIDDL